MIRHRIIRTLCCLPLLLPAACEHPDGNELFTEVSIRLVMPDSRPVERNRTTVRLRRGIYNFIVEARATYADGTTRRLYCADHANDRAKAVTWVNGQESAVLLLQANR